MKNTLYKKDRPFGSAPIQLLNDKSISLKAKGLFAYMDGKPNSWNFTIRSMSTQLKEGKNGIQSAMIELRKAGYLDYEKKGDGGGVYYLYYDPNPQNRDKPNPQNPMYPKQGRISNKDLHSKKDSIIDNTSLNNSLEIDFQENHPKEVYCWPEPKTDWQLLWDEWIEYRAREKKPKFKSVKSENIAKNKLVKDSGGVLSVAVEMVETSISNNYQGLFKPKKSNHGNTSNEIKRLAGF